MALRTNTQAVRAVISVDPDLDLTPFLNHANALTDKVAAEDDRGDMTDALLETLETYLAAHFVALYDQQYANKKTLDASASFQVGQSGKGAFETNDWGRQAMAIDVTGYLRSINLGTVKAGITWLGYAPSEQTDYLDRD